MELNIKTERGFFGQFKSTFFLQMRVFPYISPYFSQVSIPVCSNTTRYEEKNTIPDYCILYHQIHQKCTASH